MSRVLGLAVLFLVSGCVGLSPTRVPTNWCIDIPRSARPAVSEGSSRGVVRLSSVSVRAPYDRSEIAVLRADGSLAFDPYNRFAGMPSSILKGAAQDALEASGAFRSVVAAVSSARNDLSVELTVTRLALDCTQENARHAVVDLSFTVLNGHAIYAVVAGSSSADATDGNYSKAFSAAFSGAVSDALKKL